MDQQRIITWLQDLHTRQLTYNQHQLVDKWLKNKNITILNKEEFSLLKYFILLYTNSPCIIRSVTYANHPDYLLAILNKIY